MSHRLATHLLIRRTPTYFETACGRQGIPNVRLDPFAMNTDRLEGRRPGSLGMGVVAVTASRFLVPERTARYCQRCTEAYEKGEGI